jgi:NADPH2:quinone reductase
VLSLVGAVAGGKVSFDAYDLIHPVTLTGYSSESLDGQALRHAIAALAEWLRLGAIKPPSRQLIPLAEAAKAHVLQERKGVQGRILLVP